MTFIEKLEVRIQKSGSRVCVGLDTDMNRLPKMFDASVQSMLEFNKRIIDATQKYALAYKPNIAFYEVLGAKGWDLLEQTVEYIPDDILTIADAKRGDIGNTAEMYAKTFFETYGFDSVTVNPYMGYDSVEPYLAYKNKGTIVLGLTSNSGSADFQELEVNGKLLSERVSEKVSEWNTQNNCLLVVGATNADNILKIRAAAPKLYFLVPGIGAQGGSLDDVLRYAGDRVLINSSRGIIYASSGDDFEKRAMQKTKELRDQINRSIERLRESV